MFIWGLVGNNEIENKISQTSFPTVLVIMETLKVICLDCHYCSKEIEIILKTYTQTIKRNPERLFFCDKFCKGRFEGILEDYQCAQCQKEFSRLVSLKKGCKKQFCSSSCVASYYNAHKTIGVRRSKLEIYLEEKLSILYHDLEIHYNRKDAIDSELDFYIPSLNLAFELNGIFHYEPIFGQEKLKQIENNDERKIQACLERGIELCIVDSSNLKRFTEKKAEFFLDIFTKIINLKY